jgi:hypothetical protein
MKIQTAIVCTDASGANRHAIARVTGLRQTRRGIIKAKSWGDHIVALLGDER